MSAVAAKADTGLDGVDVRKWIQLRHWCNAPIPGLLWVGILKSKCARLSVILRGEAPCRHSHDNSLAPKTAGVRRAAKLSLPPD
jgi:hypothetical protein